MSCRRPKSAKGLNWTELKTAHTAANHCGADSAVLGMDSLLAHLLEPRWKKWHRRTAKLSCEKFPWWPAQFSDVLVALIFFIFFLLCFVKNLTFKSTLLSNKNDYAIITTDRMICTQLPVCSAIAFMFLFPLLLYAHVYFCISRKAAQQTNKQTWSHLL